MSEYIVGERILDMGEFSLRFQNREEIVRCRDCKRYRPLTLTCKFKHPRHGVQWRAAEPDGFCKWGERRDG